MDTTRNQELQHSINQAHASIEHMTSDIGSTNSCIAKVEQKIDTMEANFTNQFTALQ
jgi:peptidoglycan hydrolase CwlO-like protein